MARSGTGERFVMGYGFFAACPSARWRCEDSAVLTSMRCKIPALQNAKDAAPKRPSKKIEAGLPVVRFRNVKRRH
jgi:hypothetical protein